jgi:hypothetical protein
MIDELLTNVFNDEISGIDALVETETTQLTFTIVNGQPVFLGSGDLRDKRNNICQERVKLIDSSLFTDGTPSFWLCFSTNDEFAKVYETDNPMVASIVAVAMIVLTSIFFFLYDFCRQQEADYQHELLEARRQFMRFVSHGMSCLLLLHFFFSVDSSFVIILLTFFTSRSSHSAHECRHGTRYFANRFGKGIGTRSHSGSSC